MLFRLVVVGASLGGFQALKMLLGGLPGDLPLPLVVAQHQRSHGGSELVPLLRRYSALPLLEAEDKDSLVPGRCYFAPPDYHLLVERGHLALSTEAPVWYARPSIDVLFESASDAYGVEVIGVVLTGSSHDGALGAAAIKRGGGVLIVQDPAAAESPALPRAVLASAPVDRLLPLGEIAGCLTGLCGVVEA